MRQEVQAVTRNSPNVKQDRLSFSPMTADISIKEIVVLRGKEIFMRNYLPRVDWMVGTGLVVVAILSVFYGSAELTSNIASGLIGFLGRTVMMRDPSKEGMR